MESSLSIVYLEDSPEQASAVVQSLHKAQLLPVISLANTRAQLIAAITQRTPDIVFSEYSLPDIHCAQALEILRQYNLTVPFIVISDAISDAMAEELLEIGVDDYIIKSQAGRLPFAVWKTLEKYQVKREQQALLQQLTNNEKRFRTLVEHSTDAVVVLDSQARPMYVSAAVKNVLGYTPEEVLSIDIFSKAHPEDLAGLGETMQKVFARPGEAIPGHTGRMLHKDGSWRWIEATVTNLLHEPAVNGIVDNFRDVTKQKVAEELLKDKERRLSQAQAIAHLGSWETDLIQNTSVWSDEACRIYGLDEHDNLQSTESWLSFVHPEDLENVISSNQAVFESMQPVDYYHRIIRVDGQIRHVYVQTHIELNSRAEPVRLYGVVQDITEKRQADEKIIETLEERNIILESIGDGFYALDKNWVITYWNKKAELLLNRPKESILGKSLWTSFPDVVNTDIYHAYQKAVELNVIQHFEFYYESGQGWFEISAYPSLNGLSVYFRDITERKESEAQLRKLNEDLRNYANELSESNKGLDQFAYIVSHNLRAPVANIIGLGDLIRQDTYPAALKAEFLEGILVNVKRLDDVISDLNTILQVKQEVSENREKINLQQLVDNIESSLLNIIRKEEVRIQTDFSNIPELFTLKTYLYSILYNLILNSIKYRRPDRSPVISIHSSARNGLVTVSIQDNGMGIDLSKKGSQLFGLYKRFHHHVEGKGLGLFMVKTQVEMLGGRIYVNSGVNEGTEFKIEFNSDLCQSPAL